VSEDERSDGRTALDELIEVVHVLRAPGGCPWDAEQTHESLVRYLVEETHELVDAIETADRDAMLEELGDVLYQVLFHADLAAATPGEDFDLQDVAAHMTAKMVGRHPHVFGDAVAATAGDVEAVWDDLKAREKPARTSVLDGIPLGMPSLALADKLLGRADKVGVAIGEPDAATSGIAADEDELGDQLLALVASSRSRGLDPERALRARLRALREQIVAAETAAEPESEPEPGTEGA
jgi:XTP/dITP diphosphohydrolase